LSAATDGGQRENVAKAYRRVLAAGAAVAEHAHPSLADYYSKGGKMSKT